MNILCVSWKRMWCPRPGGWRAAILRDVNFKIDTRTNRVVMMGAIDNMVKGAAGQAIQNMNSDVWPAGE